MFAAVGAHVQALHRCRVGGLELGGMREGDFRLIGPAELDAVFAGPSAEEVMAGAGAASTAGGGQAAARGEAAGGGRAAEAASVEAGSREGPGEAAEASSSGRDEVVAEGGHRLTKKQRKKGATALRRVRAAEAGEASSEEEAVSREGRTWTATRRPARCLLCRPCASRAER